MFLCFYNPKWYPQCPVKPNKDGKKKVGNDPTSCPKEEITRVQHTNTDKLNLELVLKLT